MRGFLTQELRPGYGRWPMARFRHSLQVTQALVQEIFINGDWRLWLKDFRSDFQGWQNCSFRRRVALAGCFREPRGTV